MEKHAFIKLAAVINTEKEFNRITATAEKDGSRVIRKVVKYNPEFVYARFKAIGSLEVDGPNANADGFPYPEFLDSRAGYGYQSFIGKHAFVEHASDNINNAIGDLYAAYLNRFDINKYANRDWNTLKDNESDFTWPVSLSTLNNNEYILAQANLSAFWTAARDAAKGHLDSGRTLKKSVFDAANEAAVDAVVDTR